MDYLPDSIAQHLTSTTFSALTTHLNTTYLTPALTHLRSAYIDPYLIRPAAGYLANSSAAGAGGSSPAMPDLVSVVLLVAILFISLKVLDYARRVVMFWVGLLWALIWWGTIVGLVLWVYLHGVERAAQDAGWLFGIARGFLGRMIEQVERRGEYYQQPQRGADGGGVFGMGGMGGRAQQAPLGRW
ncbi:Apq12 family protein [Aspergillus homomorphus CBS 101889]|uniref:Nuclear pore assembly and biogenesis-domain-containing protein n=1 Tax=Aspergillus homomorphus (strain CBS 101889) TaxID=1450537 RepID=A0A395HX37_ASPHC|nr:hypothetical protein BO97DRAFT_406100 [Aspergillus homomorphus CBS 101889]RAL11418.1 hypothetical protein BO97DRAFT_406100 [Aspergillus homomorphus CBS 101889]